MDEYIYRLRDPRDGVIRYVGRTKDIKQRLISHISTSVSPINKKNAWINELRGLNLSPILEVIEVTERGIRREAYWIFTYLDQGVPLLNSLTAVKRFLRKPISISLDN